MAGKVAGESVRNPRRVALLGAGVLLASSVAVTAVAAGAASAAPDTSGKRPVEVTFDNRSNSLITACIQGSGVRCTNGGIAADATGAVSDPFNSNAKVVLVVSRAGEIPPRLARRTVTAADQLCATVTDGRNGTLQLRVRAGAC